MTRHAKSGVVSGSIEDIRKWEFTPNSDKSMLVQLSNDLERIYSKELFEDSTRIAAYTKR